ncbi:NAD(P)-dependent oxidoreductase [Terasakiella pusilla]|uniref:NAD(P)-dependent oxidoreductase n=1 Tax=Terasakiella pusilla TaxID=64973 RepID=UPI00048E3409|nr:DUF1932 domain-containing protein [Terasakiella pusilla]
MSAFETYKVAFIGFGEAASAFAKGFGAGNASKTTAFDIKTEDVDQSIQDSKLADYETASVQGVFSSKLAVTGADVVFSLVTADQANLAADQAVPHLKKGAFFFDCNSCAPDTKRLNARKVEACGARYVDVAIMAPVYPKMHQTPIGISGVHAQDAKVIFDALGMKASIVEGDVGAASSIKMVRSIMMKGLEALFAECVLAGRKAGVEVAVLDSLDKTYPGFDFKEKAAYMLERSMTHGIRRAAELREVAKTVEGLGLSGDMAHATVVWQQRLGELKLKAQTGQNYQERADQILLALQKE